MKNHPSIVRPHTKIALSSLNLNPGGVLQQSDRDTLGSNVIVTTENLSSSQCHDLGYSSSTLLCSSCDELKQFKLNALENSCKTCCIKDEVDAEKVLKYHRAVLQ
ncbi:unnamed protein product, partial [Didymodactylos carnosus]